MAMYSQSVNSIQIKLVGVGAFWVSRIASIKALYRQFENEIAVIIIIVTTICILPCWLYRCWPHFGIFGQLLHLPTFSFIWHVVSMFYSFMIKVIHLNLCHGWCVSNTILALHLQLTSSKRVSEDVWCIL